MIEEIEMGLNDYILVSFGVGYVGDCGGIFNDRYEFDVIDDLDEKKRSELRYMFEDGVDFEENLNDVLNEIWKYNKDVLDEDEFDDYKKEFDEKKELFLKEIGGKEKVMSWSIEYDYNVVVLIRGDVDELKEEWERFKNSDGSEFEDEDEEL